jgi:hypothetical protein
VGGLDFFIEVMVTGAVCAVGVDSSPEAVARALGEGFVEDRDRRQLRRDYGLVEFFWHRRSGADDWEPAGFTVQAHRLTSADQPDLVAGELVRRYGEFDRRLPFAVLDGELRRLGYELTEVSGDGDYRRYWLAESRALLIVTEGDLWSISGPHLPESVAAGAVDDSGRRAVRDGLAHLVRLPDAERAAWLDHRQPAPADRVNWWLYLLLVIDGKLHRHPGRSLEWMRLRHWLVEEARRRGVFNAAEAAEKQAYFLLAMRRAGAEGPAAALLPPADVVVRDCLAAIPVSLDDVATLDESGDLYRLDIEQMRQSRRARILVTAAAYHLDQLHDQDLADRLRAWLALHPHLV